jgi:hypothetical protein
VVHLGEFPKRNLRKKSLSLDPGNTGERKVIPENKSPSINGDLSFTWHIFLLCIDPKFKNPISAMKHTGKSFSREGKNSKKNFSDNDQQKQRQGKRRRINEKPEQTDFEPSSYVDEHNAPAPDPNKVTRT